MALIREGQLVPDSWIKLDDDAALPAVGDIIVSLDRWRQDRDGLANRSGRLGLVLSADQRLDDIADALDGFALIALDFPKFNDGRPYSAARLLRERYGYRGELRATGRVLRDQLLFMVRCGFDAFEVEDVAVAGQWTRALAEINVFYQPAGDDQVPVYWRRHARPPNDKAC